MARRRLPGSIGPLLMLLVVLAAIVGTVTAPTGGPGPVAVAAPPTTVPGPTTTVLDNPFLPEERNLSDCISAVPKPGCGSEARGGWRQTAVFGVMMIGLALIAWRVVAGARRGRRTA